MFSNGRLKYFDFIFTTLNRNATDLVKQSCHTGYFRWMNQIKKKQLVSRDLTYFFLTYHAGPSKVSGWSSIRSSPSHAPYCSVSLISLPKFRRWLLESAFEEDAPTSSPSWPPNSTRGWWCRFCASCQAGENRHHDVQRNTWKNAWVDKKCFQGVEGFIVIYWFKRMKIFCRRYCYSCLLYS